MVEATGVSPEGRITHGDLGLWDDEQVDGLARIASSIKHYGAVAGIQIGHAGPKAALLRPWDGNSPVMQTPKYAGRLSVQAKCLQPKVGQRPLRSTPMVLPKSAPTSSVQHAVPFANWPTQMGWWLNHRSERLAALGPVKPLQSVKTLEEV